MCVCLCRTQKNSVWVVDSEGEMLEEIPLENPAAYCAYSAKGTATVHTLIYPVCSYMCVCACTFVCIHLHVCVYVCVCICLLMCVCVCVCTHVYVCKPVPCSLKGGVVYANYGRQEDFDWLRSAKVSVAGSVVVMRVGGGVSYAEKVWHAQRAGGGGALIYPDPADIPQDPRRLGLNSHTAISEHVCNM